MDITIAPPHSLLNVGDEDGEPPPILERGEICTASDSMLAIKTRAYVDGDVRVRLTQTVTDRPPVLAWDGVLMLSARELRVLDTSLETYLRMPDLSRETALRVWVDDAKHPGDVLIEVFGPESPLAGAVRAIVDDLADGRYDRLSAESIRYGLERYPATIVHPPETGWWPNVDVVPVVGGGRFAVSAPLWTAEEGLSDLYLELTMIERADGEYDVQIDDLVS